MDAIKRMLLATVLILFGAVAGAETLHPHISDVPGIVTDSVVTVTDVPYSYLRELPDTVYFPLPPKITPIQSEVTLYDTVIVRSGETMENEPFKVVKHDDVVLRSIETVQEESWYIDADGDVIHVPPDTLVTVVSDTIDGYLAIFSRTEMQITAYDTVLATKMGIGRKSQRIRGVRKDSRTAVTKYPAGETDEATIRYWTARETDPSWDDDEKWFYSGIVAPRGGDAVTTVSSLWISDRKPIGQTTAPYQTVLGVILQNPIDPRRQIVKSGRVLLNVSDENGNIAEGDQLVSSSSPGVLMKADSKDDGYGEPYTFVGVALKSFEGKSPLREYGVIEVDVMIR